MEELVAFALWGVCFGVLLSRGQWRIVRAQVPNWRLWMLVTIAGCSFGAVVAGLWLPLLAPHLEPAGGMFSAMVATSLGAATVGLCLALVQWLLFLRRALAPWRWICLSALGWAIGGAVLVLATNAGYVLLMDKTLDQFATMRFHEGNRAEGYILTAGMSYLCALVIAWLTVRVTTHRALRQVVYAAASNAAESVSSPHPA